MSNTADLLVEIATLKAILIAADARDLRKDERIERLEKLVAAFKQAAFGRRSEKSDLLPGNRLRSTTMRGQTNSTWRWKTWKQPSPRSMPKRMQKNAQQKRPAKPRAANRGSLPKHPLPSHRMRAFDERGPRIEEVIEPASLACSCDACLHCIGEDVSERLDIVAQRSAAPQWFGFKPRNGDALAVW